MRDTRLMNHQFETVAWGLLFVWWGFTELFTTLPHGTGMLGISFILLGLNAARVMSGVPASSFTITLGILALVWGGLELLGSVLALPFEIPIIAIVLIVLGTSLLVRGLLPSGRA